MIGLGFVRAGGRYGFEFCWLVYALCCLLVCSREFFGIAGVFFTLRVVKGRLLKIVVKSLALEMS